MRLRKLISFSTVKAIILAFRPQGVKGSSNNSYAEAPNLENFDYQPCASLVSYRFLSYGIA